MRLLQFNDFKMLINRSFSNVYLAQNGFPWNSFKDGNIKMNIALTTSYADH